MEEKYWKHRARIKWLQNGDSNTKFFHQTVIQRHKFNQIGKLLTVKRSGWRAWITFDPKPGVNGQFCPISLCNFSYKVFSKILVNRLKPWLPNIISPTQNAFVGGRQIQDNIVIAHEVFHLLKLRKVKTKCEFAMKIDMNKAYDRIEWDFPWWINMVDNLGLYLGIPTVWGRSKNAAFAFIKEWVLAKIQGGKQSFLSQAGRKMLIKAINDIRKDISVGDQDEILDIVIGDEEMHDRLILLTDQKGRYTVKLGYHWVHNHARRNWSHHPSLSMSINTFVWKAIWRLDVPLKIKNFLWRRHSITTVYAWLEQLLNGVIGSTDGRMQFLVQVTFKCWNIWKSWCNVIFNHKLPSPYQTLNATSCVIASFLSVQALRLGGNRGVNTDHAPDVMWSPPPSDTVKINMDASWKTNGIQRYIRVVMLDSNSRCLAVRMRAIKAISCASVEALRVLKGYLLAQQHGFMKVIVDSDSNKVISWLNECIENNC
ncbi:hypothetical protein ACFX2C_029546 [Malus domestica]